MLKMNIFKLISKRQVASPRKIKNRIQEDLEFARRTEEAWERHDRGEFKRMEFDDFIKEMKKW